MTGCEWDQSNDRLAKAALAAAQLEQPLPSTCISGRTLQRSDCWIKTIPGKG
jgi:hypothetical protein